MIGRLSGHLTAVNILGNIWRFSNTWQRFHFYVTFLHWIFTWVIEIVRLNAKESKAKNAFQKLSKYYVNINNEYWNDNVHLISHCAARAKQSPIYEEKYWCHVDVYLPTITENFMDWTWEKRCLKANNNYKEIAAINEKLQDEIFARNLKVVHSERGIAVE